MKPKILFTTSLLLILFSCTKESIQVNTTNRDEDFFGRWTMVETRADQMLYDINGDGINSVNIKDELPCRKIEFRLDPDKTFELTNNFWGYNSSDGSIFCEDASTQKFQGTWTLKSSADTLKLKMFYDSSNYSLIETYLENKNGQLSCRLGLIIFDLNQHGIQGPITGVTVFERM